jgi:hypothetical protein
MNRILSAAVLLLLAPLAACDRDAPDTPLGPEVVAEAPLASAHSARASHFVAPMDGGQEVTDDPVVTRATGNAVFQLRGDGLHYRLIVANIQNVTMAHIHLAPAGVNGPVVAWLYPDAPPAQLIPGRSSGILATGVITADDLVGPLAGATLDDLLEAMRAGNSYVNVHTSQYPPGEIRGQIRPAGGR